MKNQMKKMYVCCQEGKKDFFLKKVKDRMGDYVKPVTDPQQAEAVYVIGEETSEMKKELQELRKMGLTVHHVNENLINPDIYESLIKGRVRVKQEYHKEMGR